MKRIEVLLLALLMSFSVMHAQESITFECGIFDPSSIGHQPPKSPINPPTVYINDYTLTFATNHPEYVLYIKDENEEVVYSTVVTSATKEVVLPSTLSGDYEIQLVTGNWCFWGYIEL